MPPAQEIYSPQFDAAFFRLPRAVQEQIEIKIRQVGSRLENFPHYRMQGSEDFRLRTGDYRVIYQFNVQSNVLYLLNLGHRRSVYR